MLQILSWIDLDYSMDMVQCLFFLILSLNMRHSVSLRKKWMFEKQYRHFLLLVGTSSKRSPTACRWRGYFAGKTHEMWNGKTFFESNSVQNQNAWESSYTSIRSGDYEFVEMSEISSFNMFSIQTGSKNRRPCSLNDPKTAMTQNN